MYIKNVLFANGRWTITVDRRLLLIILIFSCALQGQSNGSPVPTTRTHDNTFTDNKTTRFELSAIKKVRCLFKS